MAKSIKQLGEVQALANRGSSGESSGFRPLSVAFQILKRTEMNHKTLDKPEANSVNTFSGGFLNIPENFSVARRGSRLRRSPAVKNRSHPK
jgi:hypothetical protein